MEKPEPDSLSSSSTLQALPASSSGRRSSASNSPEFEFWMVRNPSFPQPQLLTADELFVDGVLLPLQLLPQHSETPKPEEHKAESKTPKPEALPEPEPEPGPEPESLAALPGSSPVLSTSKRWRDIFRLGEKKTSATGEETEKDKEKEKKKERKSGNGGNVTGTELNINIWPFSRSHSAGNGGNRPKLGAAAAAATRKVSSAPCSRSNSTGESKSRKWPSSPGRGGGVHLGRSSPVWQVRRGGSALKNSDRNPTSVPRNADKSGKKEAVEPRRTKSNGSGNGTTRVLNLNVPICIGYRHHLSCRSDVSNNSAAAAGGGVSSNSSSRGQSTGGGSNSSGGAAGGGGNTGSLLNLRTIFSKKVY